MSTLPADVEIRIDECVKNGEYSSQAEVLHAAMDALEEQRKIRRFIEGNEEALAQSRNGQYQPMNREEFLKRLKARFENAVR